MRKWHRDITTFLILWIAYLSNGILQFTREPPSVIYVSSGGTARLVWDYNVENRTELFDPYSPVWTFYNTSGSKLLIGVEDGFNKWKFVIHKDCPTRLRGRVSKESTATLVISNVTIADSGVYGCNLVLLSGTPIRSKVQLIVTTKPRFAMNPLISSKTIHEYQDLYISCAATGIPTPNITWMKLQGLSKEIKSQGIGQAFLYIPNITRTESGLYRCLASNNPNELPWPEQMEVTVVVWYKPSIISTNFTGFLSAVGKKITLKCLADGQPTPSITWFDPQGRRITKGVRRTAGGSILTLITVWVDHFGPYKCQAENKVGVVQHFINVAREDDPILPPLQTDYSLQTSRPSSYKVTTASATAITKRESIEHQVHQSMSFFQERTFTIIHLTITCVLVVVIVVLVGSFYFILKRKYFKDDRKDVKRYCRPVLARTIHERSSSIVLAKAKQSTASSVLVEKVSETSPREDHDNIPKRSESSIVAGNTIQGTSECEDQPSQNYPDYQEINTETFCSKMQGCRALKTNQEDCVTKVGLALPPRKRKVLKFASQSQSSGYKESHIYANIEYKK